MVKAFSTRAVSSFGRASALQAEGGRFDSYTAHQNSVQCGAVVKTVITLACHARGLGFESLLLRQHIRKARHFASLFFIASRLRPEVGGALPAAPKRPGNPPEKNSFQGLTLRPNLSKYLPTSGCSAAWLAHLNGVQGVEGSNPFIPTIFKQLQQIRELPQREFEQSSSLFSFLLNIANCVLGAGSTSQIPR